MKKVLHISKYYYPFKGGVEDVCKSLVDGMPEYEQKVLCFNEGPEDSTEIIDGAEIIRKGIWKELCRQPLSTGFYGMLKRTISDYKPDIIHIHVPNPLVSLWNHGLVLPPEIPDVAEQKQSKGLPGRDAAEEGDEARLTVRRIKDIEPEMDV